MARSGKLVRIDQDTINLIYQQNEYDKKYLADIYTKHGFSHVIHMFIHKGLRVAPPVTPEFRMAKGGAKSKPSSKKKVAVKKKSAKKKKV
jgi:hypothetical protein